MRSSGGDDTGVALETEPGLQDNDVGSDGLPGASAAEEVKRHDVGPPADDCCPICFDNFCIPCKAPCGHWFCGSCILRFWNYSAASKPCKCPMCSCRIAKLTPDESLPQQQEREAVDVLKMVERYNRLFVGGIPGLLQRVRELPLLMKRMFLVMMDPDRPYFYLSEMRFFALVLSVAYMATPFDFLPTGNLGTARLFDYAAILLVFILRVIGFYHRWQLNRRVRRLAVAQT